MRKRFPDIDFATFFCLWAELKGWTVPDLHIRICDWLDQCGDLALLMVFRGAAKSTIHDCFEAYTLWQDPELNITIQAADDDTAVKASREIRDVLMRHPLCEGMIEGKPAEHQFWVAGSTDTRNPSVLAAGILSNVVGSRSDRFSFDDVEVQKNIETPAARIKLRKRVSDSTYILRPGGKKLFIGTPHTHESIYNDVEAMGADVLKIPLFAHNQRVTDADKVSRLKLAIPAADLVVFHHHIMLNAPVQYWVDGDELVFAQPISGLVDLYSGNAWPEYFTRDEIRKRRKEAFSLNEWDSQYMLRARPVTDIRLDPDRLNAYDVEPVFTRRNGQVEAKLGNAYLSFSKAYWDVSIGKVGSDGSVLTILFQDEDGNHYWHRAAEVGEDAGPDVDKQCEAVSAALKELAVPNVIVETNGAGGFVPAALRKQLRKDGVACSVLEKSQNTNKQKRIIGNVEPVLSAGKLWAHVSVLKSKAIAQMRDFNPELTNQEDDYLDSLAGAIEASPVRVGKSVAAQSSNDPFRPHRQYDVQIEFGG